MPKNAVDPKSEERKAVILPSGAAFYVFPREVQYFSERVRLYKSQFAFDNVSDLASLDMVVSFETLIYRYTIWAGEQQDYWGEEVDEIELARKYRELSGEVRQLKEQLGIAKVTREKLQGNESFPAYLQNLRERAKQFGVMRNAQFDQALETFMELKAKLTLEAQTTEQERRDLHATIPDIVTWLREVAIPAFDKIDADFRANQQRMWILEQ